MFYIHSNFQQYFQANFSYIFSKFPKEYHFSCLQIFPLKEKGDVGHALSRMHAPESLNVIFCSS